ncbi:MAG: hypothetical protein QM627_03845 [Luteolibacter sp.]
MSKIPENILLLPGESGWEIWSGNPGTGFTLVRATDAEHAADIGDLPAGELLMFFPAKSITAVPMRVASDDESLFNDLATLHAERLGLRPDPMAGQLTDTFAISREPENSVLLNLHLCAPKEEDLPKRGPNGFDISARAYPLSGDRIAVWKEFGRWAFAIHQNGHLLYCQLTSSTDSTPDERCAQDIRLALTQLSLQGIEVSPTQLDLWTSHTEPAPAILSRTVGLPVNSSARPAPTVPTPLSKILPADVGAARQKARRRSQITLAAAALATLYLAAIAWFGYNLWKTTSETKKLNAEANALAPESTAYIDHLQKWDELADAVQMENSPVDILYRISRCIPVNSGLRLTDAEISSREINLRGEAPLPDAVKRFSLNLSKSNDLATFTWETPEPTNRERGWDFRYTGLNQTALAQP